MTIPVRCCRCKAIARLKRCDFAWAIFCPTCLYVDIKYDVIQMGSEDMR